MHIDWQAFSPWTALAGGVLIGLAASLFVLLNGRIAGISGILGGLLRPHRRDVSWRLLFVAGMLLAPVVYRAAGGELEVRLQAGTGTLVLAGLLVGLGSRYGAGCTSGHGVCGLSRLSPRSVVATLCFMAAGFLSVFVVRHVWA